MPNLEERRKELTEAIDHKNREYAALTNELRVLQSELAILRRKKSELSGISETESERPLDPVEQIEQFKRELANTFDPLLRWLEKWFIRLHLIRKNEI